MNLTQSILNKVLLLALGLLLSSGLIFSQSSWKDIVRDGKSFSEIQKKANEYFDTKKKEAKYSKSNALEENEFDNDETKYRRWEWYTRNRLNPDGTFPDIYTHYMDYRRDFPTASQKSGINSLRIGVKAGAWQNVSQVVGDGGYSGMGRVNDIAFHPTDANTFYLCTDGGGLWRTTDGGSTYLPLTDDLPVVKVSAVAIDPANPQVLYIAINDQIYWSRSLGIYKSTNGGATWAPTGISQDYLDYWKAVNEIVVSRANSNVVVAALTEGLRVSQDAGVTWQTKISGQFISVKEHPTNSSIIYAVRRASSTNDFLFRSTDGGVTWSSMNSTGITAGMLITDMQVTPANPNHIALSTEGKEIYRSTNGGATFTLVSSMDGVFVLSGISDDNIYYGWLDIFSSTDNGNTYTQISKWHGGTQWQTVHADQRGVRIHPLNPHLIYWCNDGGVFVYNENTQLFTELSNGIICTQFYRMDCSQTNSILIGGTQDNGGRLRLTSGTWRATNGGDAMVCKIDNTNPDILYSTYITGELKRSLNGWVTSMNIYPPLPPEAPSDEDRIEGDWVTPYVLDPSDNSTIVIGYQDVYRSTDRGSNWTRISNGLTGSYTNKIHAVAVAPSNSNVIYASHNRDLYRTSNQGGTWTTSALLSATKITSLEVHPTDAGTLWATSADFSAGNKVFVSADSGSTWTNISLNLPNFPVSDITYVNGSNNMLIIATDVGPFYKDDSMTEWARIGDNFPNSAATEVVVQYHTNKVFVSTYGRGIWEADLPVAGNEKPVVSVVFPFDGYTFSEGSDVTVTAQATDDNSVASVSLYLNNSLVRTDLVAPYQWNTTSENDAVLDNLSAGTYRLEFIATDNEGLESDPVIITIVVESQENSIPTISITSPVSGEVFEGLAAISLNALASDSDGSVASVTFQIDGQDFVDVSSPYSVSWTPSTFGTYILQAFATDNEGAVSAISSISFVVEEENTDPDCNVQQWSIGAIYSNPGTKVKYLGKLYENKWYSQGNYPDTPYGPWKLIGFCEATPLDCSSVSEWNAGAVYFSAGNFVTYGGDLYTNLYYSSGNTPGTAEVWVYQGPCAGLPTEKPSAQNVDKFMPATEDITCEIFPNPSYGLFYFTMQNELSETKVVVTIVNATGTVILKRVYENKSTISDEFDLRNQKEGLYLLKVETSGKTISEVLHVEK